MAELINEVEQRWGATVEGFGAYYIAQRDYQAAQDSSWRTLLGSLGGVLLLFAVAYRSIRLPVLIALTLLPATAAALGLAALTLGGTLSMIVSAFAAILIGLGVDFIIHLFNGYSHQLADLKQRARIGVIAGCGHWRLYAPRLGLGLASSRQPLPRLEHFYCC